MSLGLAPLRAALAVVAAVLLSPDARGEDLVISGARVFDGERTLEGVSVRVHEGRIAAVAPDLIAPPGVRVIDGVGHTLLPGLIDAHTHIRSTRDLEESLVFGVTTDLSLNMDPQLAVRLKTRDAPDRATLFSAGSAATAPSGHGTEFGWLYRRDGLEAGMLAHGTADVVLHVVTPLLMAQR